MSLSESNSVVKKSMGRPRKYATKEEARLAHIEKSKILNKTPAYKEKHGLMIERQRLSVRIENLKNDKYIRKPKKYDINVLTERLSEVKKILGNIA